jgi:hypothetical protein
MNNALVILAWSIVFLAAPAFAQVELVVNGDFEELALDENDVRAHCRHLWECPSIQLVSQP